MPTFSPSYSVSIAAPPELVWQIFNDTSTWPDWNEFTPRATLVTKSSSFDESKATTLQVGCTYKCAVQAKSGDKFREVPGGSREEVTYIRTPESGQPGRDATADGSTHENKKESTDNGTHDGSTQHDTNDRDNHVWSIVWDQRNMPEFLLKTKHLSRVIRTVNGCDFETSMTFEGPMVWPVKATSGSMVTNGLKLCAEGLKSEAERRAAKS